MEDINLLVSTSYVGNTGYNAHSRNFFRALSNKINLKVRNFTVGPNWNGMKDPHRGDIDDKDRSLLNLQSLRNNDDSFSDHPFPWSKPFNHNINLILNEVNHNYFYSDYTGPKIGYTVWESTKLPDDFFNKMKEFDQLWVPTKWQKNCYISQGIPESKIKIVREAVNPEFKPQHHKQDGKFRFLIFGRWDYRKSTKEIVSAFLRTFEGDKNVELILSADNPYCIDGLKTTEERLEKNYLKSDQIKIVHFCSKNDYIKYLQSGHVFLSCARGEGWNLPLIEAMACGTPSIYSNWGGQLEFAEGKGFPVRIKGEIEARYGEGSSFNGAAPGNYCEPDFEDLCRVMMFVKNNYDYCKEKAMIESEKIRKEFTWEAAAEQAFSHLKEFNAPKETISLDLSLQDGIRVDLKGTKTRKIEFIDKDSGQLEYSIDLKPGHWAAPNKKYYVNWKINIDGEEAFSLNLEGKDVSIVNESGSLGDAIAWMPKAEAFANKHKCNVSFYSPYKELFESNYPSIKFKSYKDKGESCYAKYSLFYLAEWDKNLSKRDPKKIALWQVAADTLGVDDKEEKPRIVKSTHIMRHSKKYVCIASQSTSQCKYWNNKTAQEKTVKYLKSLGYDVVSIDKYSEFGIKGNMNQIPKGVIDSTGDYPLSMRVAQILGCEFFIGLGSGLSWLAWALDKEVMLISGFSLPMAEFYTPYRVINTDVCHGCWNKDYKFDANDWMWCPVNKGTDKQFECSKTITFEMVKPILDKLIAKTS